MNRAGTIISIILIAIVGVGIFVYGFSVDQPPTVVIDDNATFTGYLEYEGDTRYHSFRVYENVTRIHFILKCPGNDFDLYGSYGELPSTNDYYFRGYESGGENFNYDYPDPGIWHLMVHSYSGVGHYDLIIEFM